MHISCLWCQKSNKIGKQAGQSKSRPVDSALIMMLGDIFCLVSCKWDQDSTVCIPRFHGEYNLFEACSPWLTQRFRWFILNSRVC